jgi:hypothetical protein
MSRNKAKVDEAPHLSLGLSKPSLNPLIEIPILLLLLLIPKCPYKNSHATFQKQHVTCQNSCVVMLCHRFSST